MSAELSDGEDGPDPQKIALPACRYVREIGLREVIVAGSSRPAIR